MPRRVSTWSSPLPPSRCWPPCSTASPHSLSLAAFSLLGAASALAVTPRSARALSTENEIARARLGSGGTPIAGTGGG
jgi:hypothetical protein